jgi:nitrogen regulatory protein P-II 1
MSGGGDSPLHGEVTNVNMTKIEMVIQSFNLEAVKEALIGLGVSGMTISRVQGQGSQQRGIFRGHEYNVDFFDSIKIEMVLLDDEVDDAVDAIVQNAGTDSIGDGKIVLSRVYDIVRIRNQQRGVSAL